MVFAAYNSNPDFLQALVDGGAAEDNKDQLLASALRAAFGPRGYPEMVERLLELGADISQENDDGRTLLHYAASHANPEMSALLLDRGLDINATDNNGRTPIFWAAAYLSKGFDYQLGDVQDPLLTIKFLLDQGAMMDVRDKSGNTPLLHALLPSRESNYRQLDRRCLQFLLENGADPDAGNDAGDTPILLAAQNGDWGTMEVLVEHGADTSVRDSQGNALLHLAVQDSNSDMVQQLLDMGADRKATNDAGATPCQVARDERHFTGTPILGQLCRP